MKFRSLVVLAVASVSMFFARPAHAWLRSEIEDDVLVHRSELIVVGAIKEGSIVYEPHVLPDGTHWWRHHAVLVIREMIKGESKEKEIPIIIHYGLSPLIDGQPYGPNSEIIRLYPTTKPGAIEIADIGGSSKHEATIHDARQDNVWFLRRLSGLYGNEVGNGDFGVADPEDIQPLEYRDYLCAYLTADAEANVRKQIKQIPAIATRALRFLDRREVDRIASTPNIEERTQKLLPYYADPRTRDLADKPLSAVGPAAGPFLFGIYQDRPDEDLREDIIRMWGKVKWAGCVPTLIDQLKDDEDFWSHETLSAN